VAKGGRDEWAGRGGWQEETSVGGIFSFPFFYSFPPFLLSTEIYSTSLFCLSVSSSL